MFSNLPTILMYCLITMVFCFFVILNLIPLLHKCKKCVNNTCSYCETKSGKTLEWCIIAFLITIIIASLFVIFYKLRLFSSLEKRQFGKTIISSSPSPSNSQSIPPPPPQLPPSSSQISIGQGVVTNGADTFICELLEKLIRQSITNNEAEVCNQNIEKYTKLKCKEETIKGRRLIEYNTEMCKPQVQEKV